MNEVETVTTAELNNQARLISELRSEEAKAHGIKKSISEELEVAEKKMLSMLEASDLTTYKSPHGTVTRRFRMSVKIPRSDEDRRAFFEYLKETGDYDTVIGVNSATLNSLYRDKFEQAKERGEMDFKIPGIGEPTVEPTLSFSER